MSQRDDAAERSASTDDAPADVVLAAVAVCAAHWEPSARIVGNVRAGDIVRAIAERDAEIARLRALLRRYRTETPLGHQPHMIAHEADAALASEAPRAGSSARPAISEPARQAAAEARKAIAGLPL